MAGTTVDIGHGATLVGGTSSWAADILSISIDGSSRAAIDTSHMGTTAATATNFGARTSIPDALDDAGSVTLEVHFDPDNVVPTALVAETWTITFAKVAADATAAIWAFSGFCTDYSASVPFDDKYTASMTLKISGLVTQTAAA